MAAARLWAASRFPYLSTALFALTVVPQPGLGTFAVDRWWRLYVDPETVAEWSVDESGAVLVHEVNHLLRDHAARAQATGVTIEDHDLWNVAADMEINDDLVDLPLPPGGCFPVLGGYAAGELAETYWGWFGAERPVVGDGPDCGSGAHGAARPWELPKADAAHVGEAEADLVRQEVAQAVRALGPGSAPGGLARWAEAFLKPQVDWRRRLAGAVRAGLTSVSGAVDFTYSRPSRRRSPGVVLPALRHPVPRVAVVVDTSGSMSDAHLATALAEVHGILGHSGVSGQDVVVLAVDAAVQATTRVFRAGQVQMAGGGGTDMGAGLEAAAARSPRPDVVVVLTDGLTPWPERPPAGVRVVVVVIGDLGWAPPSWAEVVQVDAAAL